MKLGFENECTIELLKTLDNFDEDLKEIFNVLGRTSIELILSKDKERIDKQAKYLSLEWKRFKTAIDKTRDICYNKDIIKKKGIDKYENWA